MQVARWRTRGAGSRVSEDCRKRVREAGTSQTTSGPGERKEESGVYSSRQGSPRKVPTQRADTETTASKTVLIRQMQEADS